MSLTPCATVVVTVSVIPGALFETFRLSVLIVVMVSVTVTVEALIVVVSSRAVFGMMDRAG
ncbi:MAG: hypothetical protein QXF08_06420, partial [Nitrososphaerota archaeon]